MQNLSSHYLKRFFSRCFPKWTIIRKFTPALQKLLEVEPNSVSKELSEISIGEGNLEYKLKRSDDKSSCYECSWSTNGITESKNKDRLHLLIFVKFADNKQLNAKVQCKMYSLKDKNHITWGTCLKNLQLDCKIKDGQTYVDVQQVLFK
ncbi:CB1 cannabinoid receptor-interacting protein 1-like isoform X2 [Acropora palmata]|uniref:CB1 cannabinoid receptor-interacting protein 1-like isoform X2 n=1 Tax=Acropora palmata TaxID=6131 RepID=UPI003DA01C46